MRSFLLAAVSALLLHAAAAAEVTIDGPYHYTITKDAGTVDPCITSSWGGSWCGYLATVQTGPRDLFHEMTFEIYTEDYFTPENVGHLAVAVRADGVTELGGTNGLPYDLRGSGMVIGSVQGYPNSGQCTPTSKPNTTALEEMWARGNCVFGDRTEGPELYNGTRYRFRVSSELASEMLCLSRSCDVYNFVTTAYDVWEWTGGSWSHLTRQSITKLADFNPSPEDLAGVFIKPVLSQHAWTMRLENLVIYTCEREETPCSGLPLNE